MRTAGNALASDRWRRARGRIMAGGGAALALVGTLALAVAPREKEEAQRANNLGVGLLEQYSYTPAAEAFRQALAKDPDLSIAQVNLAIALLNIPDLAQAEVEARRAVERAPQFVQSHYVFALVARAENRLPEAIEALERVLATDPDDIGAAVNLGQIHLQERRYAEAIAFFRRALAVEPYNATAVYNLALALTRSGAREEAAEMMARFQALRSSGHGSTVGQAYPEQGRYAEALVARGSEGDLVDKEAPAAHLRFEPLGKQTSSGTQKGAKASAESGLALIDYDSDGDLDLVALTGGQLSLLRNDGGQFVPVPGSAGLSAGKLSALGALAGDYDNDGQTDLLLFGGASARLFRNQAGVFSDQTQAAGLATSGASARCAAFGDFDHDGDLDLILPASGAQGGLLYRNNGNLTFSDTTAAAKIDAPKAPVAIVPTDFDNRRDLDLLFVDETTGPHLFASRRDGSFREATTQAALESSGRFSTVAAGDLNKDGFTDFFLARRDDRALLALSDGKGHFALTPAPAETRDTRAALVIDLDNDGLLDVAGFGLETSYVLRNLGTSFVALAGERVGVASACGVVAADLDGDGDTDVVVQSSTGQLLVGRNEGGHGHARPLKLAGHVSNRGGIGAKVEVRSGSLSQRFETYAASPALAASDLLFGLGARDGIDVLRVLWPSGILQAETSIDPKLATLTELDRKPSSCPFLYAWDGERFSFVTDFLGAGEMGYWEAPGLYSHPDPDEYVRIGPDQLRERNGRLELKLTNELEEVLYLDRAELLAITHRADLDLYPNEGMVSPPGRPFRVCGARDLRPPVAARDDRGRDVTERIARLDRRYPDDFALERIRGYARKHSLTLDLGAPRPGRTLLLLTGWTDYAFSSDNVAAHQAGLTLTPPTLESRDAAGKWRPVPGEVGVPVGRPQTIVLDLTTLIGTTPRALRLTTSMRVYWDRILVANAAEEDDWRTTRLTAIQADLNWRGFSREVKPDGREPLSYDFARVSLVSPWKQFPGRYTREGDVRELLDATDDRFVIARPGDAISLSFDARALPSLAPGEKRTYLLYADGFSKEMDVNSASPDVVMPLPFHGMPHYPYSAPVAYPLTPERQAAIDRYNTRVVRDAVPRIETALVGQAGRERRD